MLVEFSTLELEQLYLIPIYLMKGNDHFKKV
jgi:hypothetical protein